MTRLNHPLAIGVAAYSFPCACGLAQRDGKPRLSRPMTAIELMDLAVEQQLCGIEIPFDGFLPQVSPTSIDEFARMLQAKSLGVTLVPSREDIFRASDFISLHCRLDGTTRRSITRMAGAAASCNGACAAHAPLATSKR